MEVGGQNHSPAILPPIKTRYPLYRGLGEYQDGSGRVRQISPSPGFDPPTVEPVASRFTHYNIPAHVPGVNFKILNFVIHLHVAFKGL
jgi:hypothetical protein